LGSDATVAVGDEIEFLDNVIYSIDDPTDVFDGRIQIGGSLTPATIRYDKIVPSDADIIIEGYSTLPTELGTGNYSYTVSKENYVSQSSFFVVGEDELGEIFDLEVELEKGSADYTSLNEAIKKGETIDEEKYTTESYEKLKVAVDDAKALDTSLKYDQQDEIDNAEVAITDAINNLEEWKEVGFMAVAVATDVEKDYAKADKLILVFAEPIESDADIVENLSIKDSVTTAAWVDEENTVLELTIADNAELKNGTEILYTYNEKVKTKSGYVLKNYNTTISGDIEGASKYVTATAMNATIVKMSEKPGVVAGDKIVLVFNAPVYNNLNSIEVNGMMANNVKDTANTVYEIVLDDDANITAGQTLTYNNMSTTLKGSFGIVIVPNVIRALISDEDGTALTKNDKIYVFFDTPTNKEKNDSENNFDGVLEGSIGRWIDKQTLEITLGDTPISESDKINLTSLGIMDVFEIESVDCNEIELEGSFGVAIQPALLTLTAISKKGTGTASEGDEIHLAFNVKMREDSLDLHDFNFKYGDYGTNTASVKWATGAEYNDYSTIIITLGQNANVVPGTTKITINMDLYEKTGIKKCDKNNLDNCVITGTFGTSIAPNLINATVVKKVPIVGAQNKDEIVLLFNVPTNGADIANLLSVEGKSLGVDYSGEWSNNNTVYTVSLGSNPTVGNEDEITFENDGTLKDINNQKSAITTTIKINGSFGVEAEAVGVSPSNVIATIVKTTSDVGAQKGDQIVFAFNVATNGADLSEYFKLLGKFGDVPTGGWNSSKTLYTLVLGENATISDGDVISFTTEANIKDSNEINNAVTLTTGKLIGSFGTTIEPVSASPSLLSATIIKGDGNTAGTAQKGDAIVFAFNMATNKANLLEPLGGESLFGKSASGDWNKDGNKYTIMLGENPTITDDTILKITSDANLKDSQEYSESAVINKIELIGSFGIDVVPKAPTPELIRVEIVKGSEYMGAHKGDKLRFIFNIVTNKAELLDAIKQTLTDSAISFGSEAKGAWNETGSVYEITLGDNPQITNGVKLVIPESAGLKDASGTSESTEYIISEFDGTFGESIAPTPISAVAFSKDGADYIDVTFNVATNGRIPLQGEAIFTNKNLGNYSLEWNDENTVLTIALGENYEIKEKDSLFFDDSCKISSKYGSTMMGDNTSIVVVGELRQPAVIRVVAKPEGENGTITIVFSSKTNGKEDIDLSGQSSSLGIGATAKWNDEKTELTINLGKNRTISVGGGYVLLNGLGITNGFNDVELKGQYSVSEGSLPEDELKVVDARVNAREDGNFLSVTFNAPTNMYGKTISNNNEMFDIGDIAENIESSHTFGTGSMAKWETAAKLVIKLGDDSSFVNGAELAENATIAFKNLNFANGIGSITEDPITVTGSFDGREIKMNDLSAVTSGEYTTATVTVNKQDLDYVNAAIVTFVIWDSAKNTVKDINAVKIDMEAVNAIEVASKFSVNNYSKIEVYVTNTYIDDISGFTGFEILATTATFEKTQESK
jgi:hypothetical protein